MATIVFIEADFTSTGSRLDYANSTGQASETYLLESSIVDAGGTAYHAQLRVNANGRIRLRLSPTGGAGAEAGPNLTSDFLANGILRLTHGDLVLTLNGIHGDTAEPYTWNPTGDQAVYGTLEGDTAISQFVTDVLALTGAFPTVTLFVGLPSSDLSLEASGDIGEPASSAEVEIFNPPFPLWDEAVWDGFTWDETEVFDLEASSDIGEPDGSAEVSLTTVTDLSLEAKDDIGTPAGSAEVTVGSAGSIALEASGIIGIPAGSAEISVAAVTDIDLEAQSSIGTPTSSAEVTIASSPDIPLEGSSDVGTSTGSAEVTLSTVASISLEASSDVGTPDGSAELSVTVPTNISLEASETLERFRRRDQSAEISIAACNRHPARILIRNRHPHGRF